MINNKKIKTMENIYRQGDILIKPIKKLPDNLKVICEESQFVLAEGEQTGHKHLLTAESQTMVILQDTNGNFYLKFGNPVDLTHQEHKTITILPGLYEVGNEREFDYFLGEISRVTD